MHGNPVWKQIMNTERPDLTIFMGDYFDTKAGIPPHKQKDNFCDIIAFKKANRKNVILLFGNHDFHYLASTHDHYSGFQPFHKADISEMLHKAIDMGLIQMCYIHENLLFTHAGVTKTWLQKTFGASSISDLDAELNMLFRYKPNAFKFTKGKNHSDTGDDICQTPIWVRPKSLREDRIDGYIQIVGHTVQDELVIKKNLIFIDTLNSSGQYLRIIDGVMSVGETKAKKNPL